MIIPLATRRTFLFSLLAAAGGFLAGCFPPAQTATPADGEATDVGVLYHQWSKPGASTVLRSGTDWGGQPAATKSYPGAWRIQLPDLRSYRGLSFEEALERRRSVRDYATGPLTLDELSRLLYAAQGITGDRGLRTAPSAGALYPIEVYAIVHNVVDLEPGLLHYAANSHELERVETGDLRAALVAAALGQAHVGSGGVALALTAIFQRARWKYRERTYRYVLMEAGHIAQNVYLAATSLGLGACAVGRPPHR
ncbi:MAG: SagB/ThcOx family dehydrogenase [Anaerolineae bacterium]